MRRALVGAWLMCACGARTPLDLDEAGNAGLLRVLDAGAHDAGRAIDTGDDAGAACRRDADCADGVSCTEDVCDLGSRTCTHRPDDARCPLSYGCDPSLDCQARALASAPGELYEVKLPSGAIRRIGSTASSLLDIALLPDRSVYGVNFAGFYRVDSSTAQTTLVMATDSGLNALDAAPDGTLYGAGNVAFVSVDPTSATTTPFADFPPNLYSSGDIAFLEGRMLATARGVPPNDTLVEVDMSSRVARAVGDVGFACVYGLASFGPKLYGFTCKGQILTIDPDTGKGALVTTASVEFYGATAR